MNEKWKQWACLAVIGIGVLILAGWAVMALIISRGFIYP